MSNARLAYSISEVGKLLGIGRTTIYGAIKNGDLKISKVGRRTLVRIEAVQVWIDNLPADLAVNLTRAKITGGRS